ncbi:MAG: SBBP repeat-containing protein [Ignavibacteria bacterium]
MQLDWVKRYSGPGSLEDEAFAVCVDDSGNVYVTGGVEVLDGFKCTTIKYNKNGDSLWVRDYERPGNNFNVAYDMKLDDSGNVYIAGALSVIKYDKFGNLKWTAYDAAEYRRLILDSMGNIYAAGLGSGKYVVGKYDRNGNNLWVNRYNNAYKLQDLAIDNMGNVLITGETRHAVTEYDYTTIKYTNDGRIIWIRIYNGLSPDGDDNPYGITTDDSSNVYVTGASQDTSLIYNCTTVKYDSAGNVIWVKRIHPPNTSYDIEVDKSQNVYLAARSSGNSFAIKLDLNGNVLWIRTYPTTNAFATNQSVLILDSVNNVYVTVNIDSNNFTGYGAIKYNNNGNLQFLVKYKGTPNRFDYVDDMVIDKKGNVYLTGTSGGSGTYYDYATVKYSQIPTGISGINFIPDKFSLGQNYPNPFNPSTRISFSIPNPQYILLKVYDVLGNEVAVLEDEKKNAGSYEVEFDTRSVRQESNLSSGIYFYRLEADGEIIDTKRMVLLK